MLNHMSDNQWRCYWPDYPVCKALRWWGPFQQNWEVFTVAITTKSMHRNYLEDRIEPIPDLYTDCNHLIAWLCQKWGYNDLVLLRWVWNKPWRTEHAIQTMIFTSWIIFQWKMYWTYVNITIHWYFTVKINSSTVKLIYTSRQMALSAVDKRRTHWQEIYTS